MHSSCQDAWGVSGGLWRVQASGGISQDWVRTGCTAIKVKVLRTEKADSHRTIGTLCSGVREHLLRRGPGGGGQLQGSHLGSMSAQQQEEPWSCQESR